MPGVLYPMLCTYVCDVPFLPHGGFPVVCFTASLILSTLNMENFQFLKNLHMFDMLFIIETGNLKRMLNNR